MSSRISTRKCVFCHNLLGDGAMTVAEVNDKYPNDYHPGCKEVFDQFVDSYSGSTLSVINASIRSAAKRGIEWKLGTKDEAFEYLSELLKAQDYRCKLSGVPFTLFGDIPTERNFSLSLDRIDSNKGYEKGNVQFVLRMLNLSKSDLPQEDFIAICCTVADRHRASISN